MLEKLPLRRAGALALVLAVVPALAFAQTSMDRHGRLLGGGAATDTAAASATAAPAATDAGATATAAGDAGAPSFKETSAQYKKRLDYVDHTNTLIRTTVKANGKAVTDEERAEVQKHWHWTMRLYRIREIAEDLSDTASVTRADADIQAADTKFYEHLKAMNAKAPKHDGGAQ